MLTKGDIHSVGKVVDQKIEPLVKGQTNLVKSYNFLIEGQAELTASQSKLVKKIVSLEKKTERGFRKVNKDSGLILDFLEKEDRKMKDDIDRIKVHVGIPLVN